MKTDKPAAGSMSAAYPRITLASLPRTTLGPATRPAVRPVVGARAVGAFVPKVTQKAFEKYGFSAAALLTDWASIIGADAARYTEPERLRWPKAVDARGDVEAGAEGRPGATLVLRVEPARALDVQYKSRQLIERINAYFGYRAVAELRLVQGAVARAGAPARPLPPPALNKEPGLKLGAGLAAVADDGLRGALSLLAASVAATPRRLPRIG